MDQTTTTRPATSDSGRIALAFSLLVIAAIAMGAGAIFVRLADVGPFASAFWRTFLSLPILWLWMHFETAAHPDKPPPIDRSVWICGVVFAADLFFWHLSLLSTTVANATFLSTTAPIWVALGAWLLLKETITAGALVGLALCMLGGIALIGQSYSFAPERLLGDFYGVITGVFFGGIMLAVRAARRRFRTGRLSFYSTAITAAIMLGVTLALEPVLLPQSWQGVAALLALALISQVGGQGLLSIALGTLPATFTSLVIFIEAIAAAALGWVILGEALGVLQLLGGVLILLGIYVARPRRQANS